MENLNGAFELNRKNLQFKINSVQLNIDVNNATIFSVPIFPFSIFVIDVLDFVVEKGLQIVNGFTIVFIGREVESSSDQIGKLFRILHFSFVHFSEETIERFNSHIQNKIVGQIRE